MKCTMSIFLAIVILFSVVFSTEAYASSADNEITERINTLYGLIGNTYFNVPHSGFGCGLKSSGHACDNCFTPNIVKAQWFINLFGYCSAENFANSYGNGTTYTRAGWSCLGFANFAEWYIFKSSNSDKILTTKIGTYSSSYSNYMAYARVGDELRFGNSHSAIYLGADSSKGVYVLDSNYLGEYNCKVTEHYIPWSYINDYCGGVFTVARATNREDVAGEPCTNTVIGEKSIAVKASDIDDANQIIVAQYNGTELVGTCFKTYSGADLEFKLLDGCDKVKIMSWDSVKKLKPLTVTEVILCK